MNDDLLPCPFCGGPSVIGYIRDGKVARCKSCGASGKPEFHGPVEIGSAEYRAAEAWNNRAALSPAPKPVAAEPVCAVAEMKTSAGTDYFVSVRVGDREITPHMFKERWKAEYEVAEWEWLLNGGEKPDLMTYGPKPRRARAFIKEGGK